MVAYGDGCRAKRAVYAILQSGHVVQEAPEPPSPLLTSGAGRLVFSTESGVLDSITVT